jgi:hypothetical protein
MPRAGAGAAWTLTEDVRVRRKTETMRDLENISKIDGGVNRHSLVVVERK